MYISKGWSKTPTWRHAGQLSALELQSPPTPVKGKDIFTTSKITQWS